ncbi:tubulin binding cofactor A [Sistotremastrum niveocremeum HHB9708]|uniref:Tubulin-specific chaperone A n=2 Tax=Sistotremastraceae TaxID=3402574 RepID=A0A164SNX0_9AGAM|nr:tubulin binding cofactor A [Sistotremastrum niveocremeum HHB9708]KZT33403.1 tubulin binding cofactor A [Sistotremastrum suecicum HHB10207 ss-3]
MSDSTSLKRQLKIKTGVVSRLMREHQMYRTETEDLKRRTDKLVAEAGDEWHIKNSRNMVEESKKMIVDTQERLGSAVADLRELYVSLRSDSSDGINESDELRQAEGVLELAST